MSVYKRNDKYYCRFQLNGERHHYLCNGASSLREAQKMENAFKYRMQQQQNGIIQDTPKSVTLKQITDIYNKHNKINNKQREPVEKIVALDEFFGLSKDASKITRSDVEAFRMWLKEKDLSNSTINKYVSFLSVAYNLAIDDKKLTHNPCSRLEQLLEPRETIKFYTRDEEYLLMNGIEEYRKDFLNFIICAFQTGYRAGNIQYLRWEQIDIESRFIEIQPQDNKGHKILRTYISDKLMAVLKDIGIKKEGYVFINPETNNIYINPNRILKKICDKVGIKHIGIHGIRHTVATRLIEQGIPINVVQAVMGHSDIRTTMKYVHLTDNAIKNAISVL